MLRSNIPVRHCWHVAGASVRRDVGSADYRRPDGTSELQIKRTNGNEKYDQYGDLLYL